MAPPTATDPIGGKFDLVLRPGSRAMPDFRELWAYRALFWTLASRTIIARYKQTLIGILWAFARPIMMMLVMTVLFKGIARMQDSTPITVLAGVIAWQLFASSLMSSTQSTVTYSKMISKIYFPRMIIPASSCLTALVDFLFGLVVFAVLMICLRVSPEWKIVTLPIFILLILCLSFGGGLWLSALNVKYRDVRQVLGYVITFGMLLSPVGYRSIAIPDQWQSLYALLNPMAPLLGGFRWALLGQGDLDRLPLCVAAAICLLVLLTGVIFFRKMEPTFADVL